MVGDHHSIQEADAAVDTLMKLWKDDKDPFCLVAYLENVNSVKETALSNGWFTESEIYTL